MNSGGSVVLNQEKISTMTRLAIYEKNEGKEDLKVNNYYKFDYLRFEIIKAFICCTIGFLLTLLLIIMYQSEFLIINAMNLDFMMIGKYILFIYIMVIILYIIVASSIAVIKYKVAKKRLTKYNALLRKLNRIYSEKK